MGELDLFLKQEGFSVEVTAQDKALLRRDSQGHSLQKMQAHRRASSGFSKATEHFVGIEANQARQFSRRSSTSNDTSPRMTRPGSLSLEQDPASGSSEATSGSPVVTNCAPASNWSVRVAPSVGGAPDRSSVSSARRRRPPQS